MIIKLNHCDSSSPEPVIPEANIIKPVPNQTVCMKLVKDINGERKPNGRTVWATCVATKKREEK